MAPTSIMRNGLSSPIRGAMKPRPRSSLKQRPTALPMSPSAGGNCNSATFATFALSSPTGTGGPKSPHVHFPPSAVLAATYATHSPRSYDRTSIAVSPNPLALPSWGDRVYSPSTDAFELGAPPTPFRALGFQHFSALAQASPLIADFPDPRSPKPPPPAASNKGAGTVRFAPFPVTPVVVSGARPRSQSLDKSYPRSPYPSSAGFFPSDESPIVDTEPAREPSRDWPQDKKSAAAAEMSRTRSLIANGRRNKNGLSLGSAGVRKSGAGNFISISSPLTQSFSTSSSTARRTDDPSSLKRSNKPAPLQLEGSTPESERLSDDFWRSMSVPSSAPNSAASDAEAMFTALEEPYPESAVLYEATQDAQLESATAPQILYAGADGVPTNSNSPPVPMSASLETPLWSPGIPRRGAAVRKLRESLLMSPGVAMAGRRSVARKEITAPSPNDPFAAFPSFAAALEGDVSAIRYPAPVVSRA
jgi:hypothetical protein